MLGFEEYVSESKTVIEKHRDYELIDGIKWYFIELPKFRNSNPDMNNKLNQWLAFIDGQNREWFKMAIEKNKVLQDAKLQLSYLTGEEETKRLAELEEKWESDRVSSINYAKREGIKEGKKNKQIEIAKKLLNKKMSIKEIQEITELTKEEIEHIKKN